MQAEQLAQLFLNMKDLRDNGETLSEQEIQRYNRLLECDQVANPPLPPSGKGGRPKHSPAQNLL